MLKAVGFEATVVGTPPAGGFIAPNHLGYMDIVVLASVSPQVFLSKLEVNSWPVVGAYCRMAGTLYIDRQRRSDVATKEASFAEVLAAGLNMTFFLEGTSTDGRAVLPFRASLLQPVVSNSWPITPAYLKYECEDGDVTRDICWWGDMGFGSHIFRMFKVKHVKATVVFGKQRQPGGDRKSLANELYQDVLRLSESVA
ncbi:lysophospholipid acyltransferase family protein [Pelagicoccus sp. SDUM812002]|uniref:lysophospholipid acyltransferase family protein n=1 Tax=Pelagicoccus sp. SDUM812002 TaxID=3041266 RepID=UPI002810B651|nr:lysophospholipid acyltransferase family protein [Pelagicoccus sp. SDUM812002]